MKDLREDLMSHENAHDIYKVVYDQVNLVVDVEATAELRAAERRQRIARGKPYDAFVAEWVTPEPPAHLPYRSEEHTSELQSLMRTSYAVFCLKNKTTCYTTKQATV